MRKSRLRDGVEFDRIRVFVDAIDAPVVAGVEIGPGDDAAALLTTGAEFLVLSTDMSVEGVHFRRDWMTWATVGYRSTAAALSDLAAMAADPVGVLVSLALPSELGQQVVLEIATGIGDCLRRHGTGLLGGDLSRSPGPVVLDISVVGRAAVPIERCGASPGDEVWVTGVLGGAGVAMAALSGGREPDTASLHRLESPTPRLAEARWLADRVPVHALIDLSDGLAGDAEHVAAASGVHLDIRLDALPLCPELAGWANRDSALGLACGGGEDYELLLAVPPGVLLSVAGEFESRFDLSLTRVGSVTEGDGVAWLDERGSPRPAPAAGFDHFATEE